MSNSAPIFLRADNSPWEEQGDAIRAALFGELVKVGHDVVKHYHSDIYHDATWVQEYVDGPMTFYYAVRDTGTSIGTDLALVDRIAAAATYRVDLSENRGRWTVTIREVN